MIGTPSVTAISPMPPLQNADGLKQKSYSIKKAKKPKGIKAIAIVKMKAIKPVSIKVRKEKI
jgi:hypothetical protein